MSAGDTESNHSWPVGGATGDLASLVHHFIMCWLGRLAVFVLLDSDLQLVAALQLCLPLSDWQPAVCK